MVGAKSLETGCMQYELEIEISARAETVWKALIDETNRWWLADFHMVDPESVVEFDTSPGGKGLVEYRPDGSFLHWYSVQYYLPDQWKIYLVGNLAPDFGGPATSNLLLHVEERNETCVLKIVDAHHGHVSEKYIESLQSGWQQLFSEGLRDFVEA